MSLPVSHGSTCEAAQNERAKKPSSFAIAMRLPSLIVGVA